MRLPITTWREVREAFIRRTFFDLERYGDEGLVVVSETSPDFLWAHARRVDRFGAGRVFYFHVLERVQYAFQHGGPEGRMDKVGSCWTCCTCGQQFDAQEIETPGWLISVERLTCKVYG